MDKLQATYNYLKERGSEGLGNDVNEFRTKIQGDSAARAAVYNYLKDNGSEGIGNSPDEFMSIVVPGEQPQTDMAKAKTPSIMDAADTVKSKRIDPRNMTAADFQAQVQEGTKEIQTKRQATQAAYNAPTTQAVIKQTVRLKDRFKNLKAVEDKYYDTDKNRAKAVKLASGQDTEISPTLFKNYVDKMTMDRNTWNATLDGTGTDEGYESYKKNVEANAVRQIQKEDHRATNAGISILKETEDIQKNAERDVKGNALERSFIGGFGRGFGDKFDASTWTFGVRDMQDSKALLKAVDKAEAGEELTPIEEDLLEAAAVNMATKAYLSSTQGRGYKAGTVSSESLPFMLEMLVNPASTVGSAIGSKVARWAIRKFGTKGAAQILGMGARVAGDVVGAGIMTATTGEAGVAADSNRRQIGNIQFDVDEQGNAVFVTATDREKASTALWKAYGNQAIERHSELVGAYFAPMIGGVAKGARAINTKIGLSKVNDFIDNINASEWAKIVSDYMQKTQWHGNFGEFAEEIFGGVENALLIGDQTIDADKDTGVFNPSQMLDTFLGVAAMGVAVSGAKTLGYKSEKAKARQAYDEATKNAQTLFGDKWEDLQAKLIESTPEEMRKIAAEVIANPDYSTEQKRAMLSYAKADIQYTTARKMDERFSSEQTEAMNGYLNTYEEAVSGQQSADVTTTMEQKALRNKLADAFGVEPEIFDATYFAYYNDYHQQAAKMAKENPELADDINTYLINRARITGTEQKYQNEIDRSKAAITDGIKKLTYKNQIISATGTDKEHYFIVDAENAEITSETGEQGSSYRIKQKEGADNMIIIRNSNGEVKPMAISDIQYINDIEDAEQAIANSIAMETESVNNRMATELYNQGRYQPGQTVSIEGESLFVVAADNDNVTIEDAEGKKEVVPARTLREIVNASILKEKYGEERANEIIAGLERKPIQQAIQTDTQTQIDQQPIEAGDIIEITAEDGRKVNITVTQQDAEGNYFVEPEDGQPIVNGEVMPLLSVAQINDMRYVEPVEQQEPIQQELIEQAPEEITEEAPVISTQETEPQISPEEQERIKAEDAIPNEDLNATITDVFKQLERAKKEAKKPISLENTKQVKARQKAQEAIIRYQAIYDKYDAIKKRREANAKPIQTQSLTDAIAQRDAARAAADEERKQMGFNVAGESAKSKWNSAPKIAGNAAVKTLPNGKTIKGHYILAPAEAATPSHNALDAFTMSAGFPVNEQGKTVNDRDYEADKAAQTFTEKQVAANYDGQAVEQVPTVSPDGIVYDGNGRVMGSQLAAQNGTDTKYLEALRSNAANFGFTPEQVEQVPNARVMFVTDEVLPYNTETFAQFNANEKKSQNTTEKAVANSKKLNEDQVNEIADIIDSYSSIDSLFDSEKGTGDMVMAMQKAGLIGANDIAALMDGEKFSATGREFVTSVMLGSTFSEKQLREMGGNKSLKNAILRAFKPIIANSRVTDYELKEEIGNAISLIYEAKQSGNDVALHLMQKDMFQDDASARYSEFEQILALALEDGVETFRDVVKTYNEKALPLSGGQIDIFSGTVTTKDELKQQIIDYYNAKRNRGSESVQGNVAESTSNGRAADESGRAKPVTVGGEGTEQAQGDQSDSSGAVVQGSVGQKTARKSREINVAGKENSNNFALNNQEDGNDQEVRQGTSVLQRVSQTELGGLQEISGAAKSEIDRLAGRSSETQRDERSAEQIDSDIRKYAEVNSLWIPYSDIMSNTPFTSGEESDNYLDTKNNRVIKVNNLIHSHGRISELLNRIDLYNQLFPESHISLIGFTNNSDNGTVYPVFSQQFIDNSKYATESEIESHMNNLGFARTNKAAVYSNGEYIIKDVRPRNILNQDGRIYVIDAEIEKDTTNTNIAEAEAEVNTDPTEGQKKAGNYKMGHVKIDGYDITIENPKGSVRKGVDQSGKAWETKMNNTYGYIKGTRSVDGDHIDIFLSDNPAEGNVFVVDQVNPKDGTFDEHKVMYGFNSADEARAAYLSNYAKNWKGLGNITEVSKEEFKKWVDSSHRKTKPFAEYSAFIDNNEPIIQGTGKTANQIKEIVREHIASALSDNNIGEDEYEIIDIAVVGSRSRGKGREDSDLDVVVEYKGKLREDNMFNMLNDEPLGVLYINGVRVDINPITEGKSGTLKQWLKRSETYIQEQKDKPVTKELIPERYNGKVKATVSPMGYTKEQTTKAVKSGKLVPLMTTDRVTETGWYKFIEGPNDSYGVTIMNPTTKEEIYFEAINHESGSDKVLAGTLAHSYAIDNNAEGKPVVTTIPAAKSNYVQEQQALTTAIIERLKGQGIDVVRATPEMVEDVLNGREGVTFNESEVNEPQFSIRTNPAPKKTGVGYKAFFLKDGKLYPPMVANPNGEATPVGVWLDADAAPISGASKTGRPKVKAGGKGTQGGSGQLAYRPGWHLGEIPYALQFNRKDENGDATLFPKDFVWAEVEYAKDKDYQEEAEKQGYTESGKYRHSYAGLSRVPENGSYRYRTNPNPSTDPWIITGAMKVKKILSNEEVDTLVRKAGREPQKRQFLKDLAGQVYGWTDGKTIFLTDKGFNPNTPIHEYTHLWAAAVKKNAPELWANIKELMKQTPMWKEVLSDEAYASLKDNEDDICSEALSRLSGSRNAKTLSDMQSKMMDEAGKDILDIAGAANLFNRVKKAISDFWSWVGENLFNIKKFKNAEEVADRVLYDLANKTELKANTIESDNNIGAVDYKLDNNNCDYYIRYADDIESDFKRGWSSYNFGGDSFEGSKEKLLKDINYYAKKKNGGEFEISGLQIWIDKDTSITDNGEFIYIKNDVATYKLGEFSKNVWVVVDDYNAKNGLSAHLINKNFDNVGDLIKYANEHKWSYDGTGDGESFDPKISRVIFQSTMHGRTMYVIEEGDNTIEENKTVQSALSEEETIIEEAKKNGTYMKAPNGEESNLNERQWVQVRTNAFKKWFGDWENSQDSASKVVDENGEPMVVYHGTPNKSEFTIFDKKKVGIQNDFGIHSKGFYFSPNKRTADAYRKTDGNIYLEYLDVKNPLYLNSFGNKNELAEYLGVDESVFNESSQGFSIKEQFAGIVTSNIKEKGHDGVFVEYKDKLGEVIAFEPTQIKSATDNTGAFDESNPDIRFQIIDENKPGLKLSNKAVGEIFNQFVEDEQDALENVLFNWRDIELTVNRYQGKVQSYKLRGNTGRNRAFSTGIDSAPYTPSKKEFIQWLMSDSPFKGYSVDEEWKENITKLRDIVSNLMKKDLSLYKTKDGREIKFKKLNEKEEIEKVRDDKAGSGTDDTSTVPNGVQREEDPLLTNKLRRLEDGEFCNVERIFTENGYFSFTSGEKIESIEDIAYIFSDLETKSIENSFALFVKDGKPTVLHLCIGVFNQTMVSAPPIKLAYDTIKPDQVYLVHNHPSGSVFASDADVKILKDINKALRTEAKGIIIDTTSGKFGVFDASGRGEPKAKTESSPNQVSIPIKVYSFDRQVFSKDYNPTGARIYTEEDVAAFISSHRLGKRNKVNMLIISNAGNVVANLFTDKTMINRRDEDFAHEIVNSITAFGGSSVILYGDFEASLTGIAFLKNEIEAISTNQFRLLDFVTIEGLNSQEEKEESLLKEPTTDNYSESKAFHQDIAANGIKILSDQKADDMLNDIYKNITSKERDIIRGLISDGLNKADAIRKWMSDFAANGWNDTANAEIRSTIIDAIAKNVESGYMSANDARFTAWRFGKDDTVSYEDFADMVSMELETRTGAYVKQSEETGSDYPRPKLVPDQSKELYERTIGKKWFKFFEAWFVGGASVEEMQKAIEQATNTTISDANNVAMVMSHQQSINQSKIENFINRYYTPLIETIGEIKKKLGISGEAVEDYMMMKHGLERNIKLAFRDALRDQHTSHGHIDYAAVDANNAAYGADQEKKDNDIEYAKGDISYEQHRAVDDVIRERYAPGYLMYRNKDYSGLMTVTEAESLLDAELQALEAVLEFERRAGDLKDDLWNRVKAATAHTTKVNYDSGVISRGTYRRLNDMFEYYIPLKGFDELTSDDVYEYMGPDHSLFTATMKGAKGRASKADSPLAMIGSDAVASIMRGSKNLLKQRLYRIAINNPSQLLTTKDMWFVKGPNGWHPAAPDFSSLKESSSATEYNALIGDFERRMKELENEGLATHKTQGLKMDLITLPEYAQEHVVRVMVNGKEKLVYINANPRAAQAINGTLRKQDVDGMHKFIYEFSRQLAANFTTRSIKFIGRNAIKDTLFAHAMVSINEGKEYRKRFNRTQARLLNPLSKKNIRMSTLLYRLKKDTLDMSDPIQRYFKEFSQFGGETGYSRLLGVEDFREIIRKSYQAIDGAIPATVEGAWDKFNETINFANRMAEVVNRFAVYKTSREMGRTIDRSIHDAKEVTANFNEKGIGDKTGLTNFFKTMYLFVNAALQSLRKLGTSYKNHPGRATWVTGKYIAAGFMIPMMNKMMFSMLGDDGDDEWYDLLPKYTRRNNICLATPGIAVTMPLPIELRAYYALGEIVYSLTAGDYVSEEDWMDLATTILDSTLPKSPIDRNVSLMTKVAPDFLAPIMQAYVTNENFVGNPIYKKMASKDAPEFTRIYDRTGKMYVKISKTLNTLGGGDDVHRGAEITQINPAKMEHVIEGYLGGALTSIKDPIMMFIDFINGDEKVDARNVPVLNGVTYKLSDRDIDRIEKETGVRINEDDRDDIKISRKTRDAKKRYEEEYAMLNHDFKGYSNIADKDEDAKAKLDEFVGSKEYQRMMTLKTLLSEIRKWERFIDNVEKGEIDVGDDVLLQYRVNRAKAYRNLEDTMTSLYGDK